MATLEERIGSGEVVFLDGAVGTELERRGVPMDDAAWCASALISHPDTVRAVHEDYIRAGAQIITTNSFATARHVLEPAGMGNRFRELNTLSVGLAREAREKVAEEPVAIASSVSTFSARDDLGMRPGAEEARANYREQAEVLAEAGVDLILLEMMRDVEQTTYAVGAAVETGLPVWVGFSCKVAADGRVLLWDGEDELASALEVVAPSGVSLVSVMHTLTQDAPAALQEVTARWSGPVGVYAHSGRFVMPNWQFVDMISPEDYASEALGWLRMGARLIGGCCGIGPEHVRILRERLPTRAPAS